MNSPVRKDEDVRTWFRSDRVFLQERGSWFFRTREGIEIGPYETRFEAEIEAGLLKELLRKDESEDARRETVREFIADGVAMGHELSPVESTAAVS